MDSLSIIVAGVRALRRDILTAHGAMLASLVLLISTSKL
jgi:hypothetical protein